jgi:hypothetical protein
MNHSIAQETLRGIELQSLKTHRFFIKSLKAAKLLNKEGFSVEPYIKNGKTGWVLTVPAENLSKIAIRRFLERRYKILVSAVDS